MKRIFVACFILVTILLYAVAVKGNKGAPLAYQNDLITSVGGPFEASNSTSRYALTKSIVDNHSLTFTDALARFSAPDLVRYHNTFFSIFLPGVSFMAVPFYYVGKLIGMPQLTTYLLNTFLTLLAMWLIVKLARKLGATIYQSYLAGFIYLFGTNAFAYSQTLTQHPATTVLLLLAMLNSFAERTIVSDLVFGLILGAAALIDIPNAIMLLPFAILIIAKHFKRTDKASRTFLTVKLSIIACVIGMLPLLAIFAWYNHSLTGSYTKIGQTIGQTNYPVPANAPKVKPVKVVKSIFEKKLTLDTRRIFNGLYILLVSNERGITYYEPAILIGLIGMVLVYKKKEHKDQLMAVIGSISLTMLTYAMFEDPWGGWSFGPRYLIPSAALLCVFVGPALRILKKYPVVIAIFLSLTLYSVYVNSLGVLTTAAIPPKQEAENLITPIPYTYEYNKDLLDKNFSSSLVYNLYLSDRVSAWNFFNYYALTVSIVGVLMFGAMVFAREDEGAV